MRTRRLVCACLVAVILAGTAVRLSASYCFPGCVLYDVWDLEYWIFNCFDCPPPPYPEG
jgi:hypothetical protein